MNLKGRCYCGSTGFEFSGEPNWVATCHCESCRRNCSAPFTSFFGASHETYNWTGIPPKELKSPDGGVVRSFCERCGTPMAYYNDKWSHEVHFYLATLDDANAMLPTFHVHWAEKLDWVIIHDELPKYSGSADDGNLI